MIHTKVFDSGCRLVVFENPSAYSVSTGVCVGLGSCLEDSGNNGFSHFIEHMLFKGTKKRTAFEISDSVDRIGGKINAFTSKDMTCYFTRTAAIYAETATEILSDMFFNSLLDAEEIEREKKVILEEISMYEDQPDEVCHELVAEAFFGKHPLGQTIIGTAKIISSSTRSELLNFMSKFYKSGNIVLSFAGNIKFDDAAKLAEKYFLKYLKNKAAPVPIMRARSQSVFLSRTKDVEQLHLSVAFPAYAAGDTMLHAANVFASIFGGGMSSRLFQRIREEHGMAYSVFAHQASYVNNGYLEIYAGTNPKNLNNVIDLVKQEILDVVKNGVTASELVRGKEQLKGSVLLSQENSVSVMAELAQNILQLGKVITVEENIEKIDGVTSSDIDKVIKTVFNPSNACMAIVGRDAVDEKLLNNLKW